MTSLERDRVPSPRPIASKEVPLVDRVEEMNVMKEAVFRAVHGEGGLVLIHGEAGIGKTRLVRELGAYARSHGVQVLYGRCPALFRMDGVPPYVLWKEVIKDYLGECTPEQLSRVIGFYPAEVAKLVPELSQKLRAFPQSFPISPEQEQNRLFEAVSQFITNISQETPLLVVLDDLQWTDPSSLLLLHYLARGAQKTPLLLLGAYRSTDVDDKHPLTPVLAELNRERLPQEIQLKRMSLNDVSEMIKNILEQEDVPGEFCKLIYDKTRGNPFFAEEVMKSLKEEGLIYLEEGMWKFKEVSAIEFPKSVKSIVKARFSRLDDECQNVLTLASFVGNNFTLEVMCALTGIEENKLLEIMDRLIKTGFVKHIAIRGEGICSFADIIMRDVVYEEVGPFKRKKLHGVVGEALEKLYADKVDEHLGELALHFLESGDEERALSYFLKAGEKAVKVYANSGAASYFQSALKLLQEKEGEVEEKARVLERLGDIKELVGEYDACIKYWREALDLRNQLFKKTDVARLHRKTAHTFWEDIGNAEKAKEHYDEALGILQTERESVELASLFEDVAHMYYRIGDMSRARSWAEKALEPAKKLNADEVIASSYASLGTILAFTGDLKKSIECYERALKIALDNGYMETALRAYCNMGASLPRYEYERRMELLEKGHELAKRIGHIGMIPWIDFYLAYSCVLMGRIDKAVLFAEESIGLDRRAGNTPQLSNSLSVRGFAYQVSGEWDRSEQCYKEAASICLGLKDFQMIAWNNFYFGWLHFDKGEYAKAIEFFEKMHETCEEAGAKYMQVLFSQFSTWSYIEHGENDKAKKLTDTMEKFALQNDDKGLIVAAEVLRAALFRVQKNWKESIERFEKALHGFDAVCARQWDVYSLAKMGLYEYAKVYLERDQEGDKEKAHNLLNQALEIFQKMGAKKDVEKVEAKIAFIEGGKEVSKPKPVEYVSTGYTDLDKLLCGGIPSSCALVLTSLSCTERGWLIKKFLETGAKRGETTFLVTIDPSAGKTLAEEFPSTLYLFICNPEADAIIKSSSNVFTLKGVENLTEISIALTSAIRKLDPSQKGLRRICISLVSDVLLQHHAVETRRWLTALITKLKSEGFTTLAVMDPEMHPSQEVRAVLDLFDGEISICEKDSERFLKVRRMSNQKYLESELRLKKEDLDRSA